jgi:hypothetical protein
MNVAGIVFLAFGLCFANVRPLAGQTLRAVLADRGVQPPKAHDLDDAVSSYAVFDDSAVFIIAYYTPGDTRALDDSIRIRVLRKADSVWQSRVLHRTVNANPGQASAWQLGSVVRVVRTSRHIVVDTHLTPSAGTILLLSADLEPVVALPGWVRAIRADGFLIFQRSMVHFAPTHPAELWGFDANAARAFLVYPSAPYQPIRAQYIDEVRNLYERVGESWFRANNHHMDPAQFDSSIQEPLVLDRAAEAIAFVVRFGGGEATPVATPVLDVVVVCRKLRTAPQCLETTLNDVRRGNARQPIRELLEALLTRR